MIASVVEGTAAAGSSTGAAGAGAVVIDVYARISYAVTGETVKTDDQVEMGEEALERRGAVLGKVFHKTKSAWKPGVVRKDWEALMRRLESGESHGVGV
jgi:site-specific DNA recombinase